MIYHTCIRGDSNWILKLAIVSNTQITPPKILVINENGDIDSN